jgi:hypothetical protein
VVDQTSKRAVLKGIIHMNLSDRALLTSLRIGSWSGRKLDKRVTQDVARTNGVTASAGRYNKCLLPNCNVLENIHSKDGLIRDKYYQNTLPWGIEGTFMLPTSNYLGFMTEFRREKAEREALVERFVDEYPTLVNNARASLGPLFQDADYPTQSGMARKFYMEVDIMPVPSTDFRVQIASDELERIQQDVEARIKSAHSLAMQDLWNRVYDKVKHIAEKCADPKAIFRDSMIDNARELCELLPRLNFADDPRLETMRQEIESKLLKSPEVLRLHPEIRRDTAAEAKAIMDKMSAIMGGM